MADWSHYSTLPPEWEATAREIIQTAAAIPSMKSVSDIASRRATGPISTLLKSEDDSQGKLIVTDVRVPVSEDADIAVRVYRPTVGEGQAQAFPVLVTFHGGGYCFGNLDNDDPKCRTLAVKFRLVAFNVDYRLAPEYPYPTGVNDSFEATKWISKHAAEFGGDIARGFILCGLSAGSLFTEVITQRARDDPELADKFTGHVLQIPPALGNGNGFKPEKYKAKLISYEQNKNDPVLTRNNIRIFIEAYKADPDDHPYCSPLLTEPLAGLPPAYFQIAGGDILRDEGLLYAELLSKAGVPTKVDVYPGLPHGFHIFAPNAEASKKWDKDLEEGMRWLLAVVKAPEASKAT